jgi:TctA family transporter
MEVDMLGNAILAFNNMMSLERLGFLSFGVLIGLVLGVIPGLGGLVGLSLLLPFTFNMDPYTALAFMMGLQAVVVTSDTIPAVLFGVPGTVGSAATILDGYPMARKGEAGRAFGAAFSASVIGGLFGALLLGISVPILRPIVLEIGSPELLAICVFGLSLVAVLSGGSPLKGLAGACIGLMVATAGDDPQTGTLRWTFDSLYLWDGLPVVPLALGLFAVPELADMAITKQSISVNAEDQKRDARFGQLDGIRDTFQNWFLVLRCATIGSFLGAVPGIGASVIDWIAYGHAARTEKGAAETFGKGDVRGVIASEASNNAKEGGALVPTIAFGVPGSASMALILGAFLIHGLVPGPEMLTTRLDVTYTLVWSVAIANVLGAGICFAFANQLAKVALIRIGVLAPVVLAITYIGAFQGSRQWGDIYALLIFGLIGWVMKRLRWPRPPLILGFVLGGLVERYMFISVERYGADWLWIWRDFGDGDVRFAPYVPAIFLATLYGVLSPIIKGYRLRAKANRQSSKFGFQKEAINPDFVFALILFGLFATAFGISSGWEFGARLIPQTVAIAAMIFIGWLVLSAMFIAPGEKVAVEADGIPGRGEGGTQPVQSDVHFDISADYGDLPGAEIRRRVINYFAWLLFFFGAGAVVGLLPAMFLFMVGYMRFEGKESWKVTLLVGIPVWLVSYMLFHKLLIIPWPQTLVGDWFPVLRTIPELNMF